MSGRERGLVLWASHHRSRANPYARFRSRPAPAAVLHRDPGPGSSRIERGAENFSTTAAFIVSGIIRWPPRRGLQGSGRVPMPSREDSPALVVQSSLVADHCDHTVRNWYSRFLLLRCCTLFRGLPAAHQIPHGCLVEET